MAARGSYYQYVLLQDVSDDSTVMSKVNAYMEAQAWPGYPKNPISPNPIPVNVGRYTQTIKPTPSLGGRKTVRGRSYTSLANYNNIP